MTAPVDVLAVMRRAEGRAGHPENAIEVAEARAAVAELLAAAREAEQDDGGTRYDSEDDEIGTRACCYVLSYEDHEPDCHITKLRAALARCRK